MSINEKNKQIVKSIRGLVEICKDGEKGYKDASEHVDNEEFRTILYRLSQQRTMFRSELENDLIKDYGTEAKTSDSVASKLHRGWLDFKSDLKGNDTKAVLKECERGEQHAIDEYTEALKGDLPAYLEERVKNQLEMIKGTLSQLRAFESEVSHA